jgi:hypothetical protein
VFRGGLCRDVLVRQDECLQVVGYHPGGCLVASLYPDLLDAVQAYQLSIQYVVPVWQHCLLFAVGVSPFRFHQLLKSVQRYQDLPLVEWV